MFRKERFVGICAVSHRFAGKKVQLEEIFAETVIVREKGSGTREIMEQVILQYGFALESFHRIMTISDFSAIQRFVNSVITSISSISSAIWASRAVQSVRVF